MGTAAIGARGEQLAANWYRQNGYRIVERNFRTRLGEIDLIVQNEQCLVFCEVKTRKQSAPGTAAMAVTPQKQRRIVLAARGYLATHGLSEPVMRFDVAEVYHLQDGTCTVRIIENAFEGA